MESANSHAQKSCGPPPAASRIARVWQGAGIAVCLAWGLRAALLHPNQRLALLPVIAAVCMAWELHLEYLSLPRHWSGTLAILLAAYLLAQPRVSADLASGRLATGILLYLMVWALSAEHGGRGLQGIATLALLLSISLFTSCGCLLSALWLTLFALLNSRGRFGGYVETAILLFTPAVLYLLIGLVLRALSITVLHLPVLHIQLPGVSGWGYQLQRRDAIALAPSVILAIAALGSRLFESRTDVVDLAYLVLLLAHMVRILLSGGMDGALVADFQVLALAGALCLLAIGPPRRLISRLLVTLAPCASIALLLAGPGIA